MVMFMVIDKHLSCNILEIKYDELLWFSNWGLKLFDFTLFLGVDLATCELMEITGRIGSEIDAIESWTLLCPSDGWELSESLWVAFPVVVVHC